jgi:hypothetical protein
MSDASESEAALTKGQRASARSSLRYASYPDPSSTSSGSSLGKCDKTATKAYRVPHRTPLVATMLIWFSNSSATLARDGAHEDDSPVSPSTEPRTSVADARRAFSSTFAQCHLEIAALSHPADSSSRSAQRAWPGEGLRSKMQILALSPLSGEHNSSSS